MSNAKIETLTVALNAIAECLKVGKVTNEALAPIAGAIALGIAPPFVRASCRPFALEGVKAQPGTWPHFAKALCNIESQQLDLSTLREKGKAGDVQAERRANFVNMVLTSIHGAFVSAHKRAEELEQAETRKLKAAVEARETEEQRKAREARQAARRALEAAALGNAEAPVERAKPQDRRHTPEGITRLITSEAGKRVDNEDCEAEATLAACRFVFRLIHDDEKSGRYTVDEISLLKSQVKAAVSNTYFRASGKLAEAEREAEAWMQRGEQVMAVKDRASAPQPAKTPAPTAAKPAAKPAPKTVKPAEAPRPAPKAALPELTPAGTTHGGTTMGLALQKAGIGKAANG